MKGVILKHSKVGTYILDERGTFATVPYFSKKPIGSEVHYYPLVKPAMQAIALAACLVLVISSSFFIQKWDAPALAVYIDVNPGVRLEVNALGNVIGTTPTNEDGDTLLKKSMPKGRLDQALETYFAALKNAGFDIEVGGERKVLLTIVCDNKELTDQFSEVIHQVLESVNADIVFTTRADEDRAMDMGLTPGRLQKAEELSDEYPDVDIYDLARIDINTLTGAED